MGWPFWDWRRSNSDTKEHAERIQSAKIGYEVGLKKGLKVAEEIADWMQGQDKSKALEHVERMRKNLCE